MPNPRELTTAEMDAVSGGVAQENGAGVDEISTATPTSGFAFQRVRATAGIFSSAGTSDGAGFATNSLSISQPGS